MPRPLTRLTPRTRRTLQIVAVSMMALGALLFMLAAVNMVTFSPSNPPNFGGFVGFGFGGVLLLGIGGQLASMAFLKPLSEIAATETEGAVTHVAAAAGQGLSGQPSAIRIRCRSCAGLAPEDATFCPSCGNSMA